MLDAEALRPVLSGLHLAPLAAVTELDGSSAPVFRLDLEDGSALILKAYDRAEKLPYREKRAAELLVGSLVPHPRYLLIDESLARLPYRFALMTYVAGRTGRAFTASPDLFVGIGRLARDLHSISLFRFGSLLEPEHDTNSSYVRALADHAFGQFLHYGAEPALTHHLRRILDDDFPEIVLESDKPVFAHDDLHPGNVLAMETETGIAISGLIDFGNARASCAVMDLAKTIFICEHEQPGSGSAILEGYGPLDHPVPDRALAFYTLLHRVIMWWWLRHIGVLNSPHAESDVMTALRETAEANPL